MKKTFRLMLVALLAFGMFACGEKKLTEDDLKQAEKAMFNDDMTANPEAAAVAVEQFCKFAKQNPDDPKSPDWLFKALEVSVGQKDAAKSEAICQQLMNDYPTFEKTPIAMFMMASMVYDDQLKDLDKARAMFEKIIADYPESEIRPSAEAMMNYLGLTPEEILMKFEAMEETAEQPAE